MNKNIHVYFDSIMRDKENNEFIIQGWCLNLSNFEIPDITLVETNNILEYKIDTKIRPDVNAIYNLDNQKKCGFNIVFKVKELEGIEKIVFTTECLKKVKTIKLNKDYQLSNEYGGSLSNTFMDIKRGLSYFKRNGLKNTLRKIKQKNKNNVSNYSLWIKKNELTNTNEIKKEIESFKYTPFISIVMPVYNVEEKWLTKCIESVQKQYYTNWELCIADDCSSKSHVKPLLEKMMKKDGRIKVVFREKNGHICEATNSALSIAQGEYVGLLDNDDELAPNALFEVVKLLNKEPELDLIYSDEDKIDKNNQRKDPTFKPDWSPEMLMGTNYICHFGVYRRAIIEKIGGFRKGFEGAQDYDLVLRFTEVTDKIGHISKILYHWRMLETSTAVNQSSKNYAFEAGKKALNDALERRGLEGIADHAAGLGLYDVKYCIKEKELVSIIIPTRDGYEDIKKCVDSIIEKTKYDNYEIIIADNGTTDLRTLELFERYKKNEKILIERIDIPFNYSRINNIAVNRANGKYLLFLNNDTEVITEDWLDKMVSYAQFDDIGAVGAKLYYPDNTIQHAGVILGLGGAAGHGHHTFPRGDFGYFGRLEINCNYSAVTAACMMVKVSDFEMVSGFNENLTVAFNDVDLCLKLLEKGKRNVWLHGVELYHFESKSRGLENTVEKQKRFSEETQYMYDKWGELIEDDPYYNPNLTRKAGDYTLNL